MFPIRLSHLLFLLFLNVSVNAQDSKYLELYEKGEWKKCLKKINNEIENGSRNPALWLYHSYVILELSNSGETELSERSVYSKIARNLVSISRKDKSGDFSVKYSADLDSLCKIVFNYAASQADDGHCERVSSMLEKLKEHYNDLGARYLIVKCDLENGSFDSMDELNAICMQVYSSYYEKGLHTVLLPEAFILFSSKLMDLGAEKEALVILRRAAEIFPGDELVEQTCINTLDEAIPRLVYEEEEGFNSIIDEIKLLESKLSDRNSILKLKWKYFVNYLSNGFDYGNLDVLKNGIERGFIAKRTERNGNEISYLKDQLIALAHEKWNESDQEKSCKIMNEAIETACFRERDCAIESKYIAEIRSLIEENREEEAAICLYCGSGNKDIADKLKDFERTTISSLIRNYRMAGIEVNLSLVDTWKELFPLNRELDEYFRDIYRTVIAKMIDSEDFSASAPLIRKLTTTHPNDPEALDLMRRWIIADFRKNYLGTECWDKLNWKNNLTGCDVGKYNSDIDSLFIVRLNYFRRLAGLYDQCKLDQELNHYAQAAAHLMYVNGSLSHSPPQTWECYNEDAASGAGSANLSLGRHSSAALTGQMNDGGSGNESVGHRRWILNPSRKVFGHGSTSNTMALVVMGGSNVLLPDSVYQFSNPEFIAWPPQGMIPSTLAFQRWSFSLASGDFSTTKVSMRCNGKSVPLIQHEPEYGYGLPTIVWEPDMSSYQIQEEVSYEIILSDIKTRNPEGKKEYRYEVILIPSHNIHLITENSNN